MHIHQQPDSEQALTLLRESGLPVADLSDNSFEHFFAYSQKNNPQALLGIIGVEFFDNLALLRSLAVAEKSRGKGCGKSLVENIERYAQGKGTQSLYLLTDTAEWFFARLGYLQIPRDKAPDSIRLTAEFTELCSDQAVLMKKDIQVGHFMSIYP